MTNIPIKIGLIINPIAGMGGSVGLKGTDGIDILQKAQELGAIPHAIDRTKEFLHELRGLKQKITIVTVPGIMGENICRTEGFNTELISHKEFATRTELYKTTAVHTKIAAQIMKNLKVAIIVFIGGDGTARNIFEAVQQSIACIGVPGGVKIHSSVFATNPNTAGLLVLAFLWGEIPLREAEVLDIDEDAFRGNRVVSKLYGYLLTPYSPLYSQPSKMGSPDTVDEQTNQQGIARWIVEEIENRGPEWYYLLGPGTTIRAITQLLHVEKTLLGVDLLFQNKIIAQDLNEQQILTQLDGKWKNVKLIVTPIGAQGFIFGRGNLQLSDKVLKAIGLDNLIIIATKYKISTLPNEKLRIDSRNIEFDIQARGLYRVLVDYAEYRILEII